MRSKSTYIIFLIKEDCANNDMNRCKISVLGVTTGAPDIANMNSQMVMYSVCILWRGEVSCPVSMAWQFCMCGSTLVTVSLLQEGIVAM